MGPVKRLLARRLFGRRNLITINDPYAEMARLLSAESVTGIIDVGASHGRVARRLLRRFPQATAYLFEPNPDYRHRLEDAAAGDPRLVPVFQAVGEEDGAATLHVTASAGTTSLLKPARLLSARYASEARIVREEQVVVTTLDSWSRSRPHAAIQLMKLDIQGGELAALRGAGDLLGGTVKLIYTEVLFNPLYDGGGQFAQIDILLRTYGFALHDLFKPRYDNHGMLLWGNALYLRT
ncbi:MAG: FkbM family methyltransferase [Pseudomonadales bacterium]